MSRQAKRVTDLTMKGHEGKKPKEYQAKAFRSLNDGSHGCRMARKSDNGNMREAEE